MKWLTALAVRRPVAALLAVLGLLLADALTGSELLPTLGAEVLDGLLGATP